LAYSFEQPHLMQYCDNLRIFKALKQAHIINKTEQALLSDAYQKLRALGHYATMQSEQQLISHSEATQQGSIRQLWDNLLTV
jgi:[glutamine synthetase] adenylyltransferase / [glutamine synthetase]-adenylyl-L-tyrosine phosphorylase